MLQRYFAVVTMAALTPAWSTAQVTPGYGGTKSVPAKAAANAAPAASASNGNQGCSCVQWSGPALPSFPARSGFCDTWRGGFIGLKYRCFFRRSYGYPYYGPSYPLFAQGYPSSCGHPVIGTVYASGCGVAHKHGHACASAFLPPIDSEMAPPSGAMGASTVSPKTTPAKEAPSPNRAAHLQLVVPEQAEVWIGEHKTARTGSVRQFVSPPLTPEKSFTYQIIVRYRDDNGAPVENKRSIRVRANDRYRVDFTARPETIAVSAER